MARTILTELALFATPFAIYAIALVMMRRDTRDRENWGAKVIAWLAVAGIVLVAISLVWFSHYGGFGTGTTYIPAHIENGKLVPGRTK